MKKMLSRIGIGAAVVDTVLPKTSFELGETFEVEVNVQGGAVAQDVEGIDFALLTLYDRNESLSTGIIAEVKSRQAFTIAAGEQKSLTIPLTIPYHSPLTLGATKVWLKTGLDIDWSLDPRDSDDLQVRPDDRMRALLDAIESLGFTLKHAHCESAPFTLARPFVQELAFRPSESELRGRVNEIELICDCSETQVHVLIEVDRRARGLLGALGAERESKSRYSFSEPDVAAIAEELRHIIESSLR